MMHWSYKGRIKTYPANKAGALEGIVCSCSFQSACILFCYGNRIADSAVDFPYDDCRKTEKQKQRGKSTCKAAYESDKRKSEIH